MGVIRSTLRLLKPVIPKRLLRFYEAYRREYPLVDRSQVTLFAPEEVLPGYTPRRNPYDRPTGDRRLVVSLIATVRNEAATARPWLESLLGQTRRPDQVVIVDGGSADGTPDLLREFARSYPIDLKVIEAPGANIARGRNLAIRSAAHPLIACTDFGCTLEQDWLENLVAPFELDEEIELSAGYYRVYGQGRLDQLAAHFFGIDPAAVNPQDFLPSGRSLALKKTFWEQAGGYPEWLTDAGEDTLFDYQAKSQPSSWAFVPGARVAWRAPRSLWRLARTYFRYSRGDGESGTLAPLYWYKTVQVAAAWLRRLCLLLLGLLLYRLLGAWAVLFFIGWLLLALSGSYRESRKMASELGLGFYPYAPVAELVGTLQMLGFAAGVLNRPRVRGRQIEFYRSQLEEILAAHPGRRGVIVYPPTHDWGFMFQRPHQMARAFARQGYLYFYCTVNERTDAVFGFREVERSLYLAQLPMETFAVLERPVVYIGSPWNRSCLPFFDRPRIIYDHYDDLVVSGGQPEDHQALLQSAAVVLVTSQALQTKILPVRPDALLVPNAVDAEWITCARPRPGQPAPDDWRPIAAAGQPVIGYSGALAEWFDYGLLSALARSRPDLQFVLVGLDYDGSLGRSGVLEIPTVHWLGMKPYAQLFEYVWRFDVGCIPFRVNAITRATSPIKLFEYMACELPVVTTPLPECRRYPGVFIAGNDSESAVEWSPPDPAARARLFAVQLDAALQARRDPGYLATLARTVQENTWNRRVEAIRAAMGEPARQSDS